MTDGLRNCCGQSVIWVGSAKARSPRVLRVSLSACTWSYIHLCRCNDYNRLEPDGVGSDPALPHSCVTMSKYLIPLWFSLCTCKMGMMMMAAPIVGFCEMW